MVDEPHTLKRSQEIKAKYGSNMFNVSRSGLNLVSNSRCSKGSTKVRNLQKYFLPERVVPFWNKLPSEVKRSESVLTLTIKLEEFKKSKIADTTYQS